MTRFHSANVAMVLLVLGFVALGAMAVASHRSMSEVSSLSSARARALQTQVLLERMGTLVVDLETGQRGYAITGDETFLEPYHSARHELSVRHVELARLLADTHPDFDRQQLNTLDALIERRLAQSATIVQRRREIGDAVLRDFEFYMLGKQLMDSVRLELTRLRAVQAEAVQLRTMQVNDLQREALQRSLGLTSLATLFVGFAVLQLWLERRRRDRAERTLRELNTTLEQQVAQRTAELQQALERIQSFATELDQGIEAERRRLAREVHDQIGQVATAIKMQAQGLLDDGKPTPPERVDELLHLVDEAISTSRRIASELRPPLLDDLGLGAAVQHLLDNVERQGGPNCTAEIADDESLDSHQANQLFRIVQEAVTNVLRHARARHLWLRAWRHAGSYCLTILDDGQGPGRLRPGSHGLRNMRERAALGGGTFEFGRGERGGTQVRVVMPVDFDTLHIPAMSGPGVAR